MERMNMSEGQNTVDGDKNQKIEYVTSNFVLHKFTDVVSERKIIYQVIKMTDSLLIFINDKDNMQLVSMFVALVNRYSNLPVSTRLLGGFMEEEISKGMACRMSKKLNKTVFVSCNIEDDRTILPLIEKRIYDEISEKPEMF